MRPTKAAIAALLVLATCTDNTRTVTPPNGPSSRTRLGTIPPSEVATWQEVGTPNSPSRRFLQAAAFDEIRKVVVLFGGTDINRDSGGNPSNAASQETWEWDPVTGKWTNRTVSGTKPEARSGAAMVYDSTRDKHVLFGGRTSTGLNLQDTWEWDGKTGTWTAMDIVKNLPSARAQHAMVFEKSTGKVLLFGGGRSSSNGDDAPLGIALSLGDTWQYDPATQAWSESKPATAPAARHDLGMAWDSARNKAVLFGGLSVAKVGDPAAGKQDVWDWDPTLGTWTEQTATGDKPSARCAHGLAFDANRKKVVLFGGWDASTGFGLRDLWDWNPTDGTWSKRLSGTEAGMPWGHVYASLVADDARARLLLVTGATGFIQAGIEPPQMATYDWRPNYLMGTRDVWEIDPAAPTVKDRSQAYNVPPARIWPAMGYNQSTGKAYLFGGSGKGPDSNAILDDTWEWDGQTWAPLQGDVHPDARDGAALAYDPARKSMILYGGRWAGMVGSIEAGDYRYEQHILGDTWELDATGKWSKLAPKASPEPLFNYGMTTDTTRKKILLYAGTGMESKTGQPTKDYMRNTVWEWDGATLTWTDRSPLAAARYPSGSSPNTALYHEGRQKMFLYDGSTAAQNDGTSDFWEWDPISAGWTLHVGADKFSSLVPMSATYDSIRRRIVILTQPGGPLGKEAPPTKTLEVDVQTDTWYVRSITNPTANARMIFDRQRGVAVTLTGMTDTQGGSTDETWQYKVSNLGNGEGCTAAFASSCASGLCADGVCCTVAACKDTCQACNVSGSEGTCAPVKAGTVVAGSCDGKACAADGKCLAKNGEACTTAAACASGFCADGVCCDSACTGHCVACNQTGQAGACRPFAAGSDPEKECGVGTGACKSTCDGVGECVFPIKYMICGDCMSCDGNGECKNQDRQCAGLPWNVSDTGGTAGSTANPYPTGSGGSGPSVGGAGGGAGGGSGGSATGGSVGSGGSNLVQGGSSAQSGGGGGSVPATGGNGQGGSLGSGGASLLRDADVVSASGGAGGTVSSVSSSPRDGAASPDAALVAQLRRDGCSCRIGGDTSPHGPAPWLLLVGSGLVASLWRRRRNN
jgi:MYXO-CTERM domain-containing protein